MQGKRGQDHSGKAEGVESVSLQPMQSVPRGTSKHLWAGDLGPTALLGWAGEIAGMGPPLPGLGL